MDFPSLEAAKEARFLLSFSVIHFSFLSGSSYGARSHIRISRQIMVDSIDRKGSLHIPSTGDIRITGVTPDAIRPCGHRGREPIGGDTTP